MRHLLILLVAFIWLPSVELRPEKSTPAKSYVSQDNNNKLDALIKEHIETIKNRAQAKDLPQTDQISDHKYFKKVTQYQMEDEAVPTFLYKPECQRKPGTQEPCKDDLLEDSSDAVQPLENHDPPVIHEKPNPNIRNAQEIPYCPTSQAEREPLVIVSTLDGQLTGFGQLSGKELWSHTLDTNKPQLVTSSAPQVYLSSRDHWYELVPALGGQLYIYDGERYESLPVSTKTLLTSSRQFTDGNLFTGFSESFVLGILPDSGKVLYRCANDACTNLDHITTSHVLVLTRDTHTIHSIDPRTGQEKWNMTVGQHHVNVAAGSCQSAIKESIHDVSFKFSASEGIVSAYDSSSKLKWKQKVSSPIAYAWSVVESTVEQLDTHEEEHNTALATLSNQNEDVSPFQVIPQAFVYEGTHDGIKYVQERLRQLPGLPLIRGTDYPIMVNGDRRIQDVTQETLTIAATNQSLVNRVFNYPYIGQMSATHIVGALFCTLLALYIAMYHLLPDRYEIRKAHAILMRKWNTWIRQQPVAQDTVERTVQVPALKPPESSSSDVPSERQSFSYDDDNSGRLRGDYDFVKCLGKGGYGVVFHLKHKIDNSDYAVKRIALPRSDIQKIRVLREARSVAKLMHPNIVRYYSSWEETKSKEWIRKYDEQWKNSSDFTDSEEDSKDTDNTEEDSEDCDDTEDKYDNLIEVDHSESDSLIKFDHSESDNLIEFDHSESDNLIEFDHSESDNLIEFRQSEKMNIANFVMSDESDSVITFRNTTSVSKRSMTISSVNKRNKGEPETIGSYLYIAMELCSVNTLQTWLENPEEKRDKMLSYFNDIVKAVEFIHDNQYIHRDLKPSNIFFSIHGEVKVGDFGLVTGGNDTVLLNNSVPSNAGHGLTMEVGTTLYMSPELTTTMNYNYKVDIFSLGVILMEMLSRFKTKAERHYVLKDARKQQFSLEFIEKHPNEVALLNEMLSEDPSKRPTTRGIRSSNILKHLQSDLDKISDINRYNM